MSDVWVEVLQSCRWRSLYHGGKAGAGKTKTPMVLRMEPAESIVETSRLREFQLMRAFEGILPVPRVYWVDSEGDYLPRPELIYEFVEGVIKPTIGRNSNVTGIGTYLGHKYRKLLAPQFFEHWEIMYNYDFTKADLSAFDIPKAGSTQAAEWAVNWWERVWEEDADEDVPLMRLAAVWLRENLPVADKLSIVHTDYRIGNCLFNEEDGRITAWLDWELGHIGDRHECLAYPLSRVIALSEYDKTLLIGGLMPRDEFLESYEKASGLSVNPKTLFFYRVHAIFKQIAITLGTGYRITRGGKTHQDVLVLWLMGISSALLSELTDLMEKGE